MSEQNDAPKFNEMKEYKGRYVLAKTEIEDFSSFQCREDDVWVCSFPRSGTTFTQQMVYLIMTLDFDKATRVDLDDRFPYADLCDDSFQYFRGLKYLNSMPPTEPRMIKSHVHHSLLPDELKNGKGKIVYITRNPKASIVSAYKFWIYMKQPFVSTLREYIEKFLTQNYFYCPWGLHVREYWEKRDEPSVLFLQYEKVIQDRRGTIKIIADFLGKDLTEAQIDKITDYTSLESMKNNKTCNMMHVENNFEVDKTDGAFINKGEPDGWKKELPDDLKQKMDEFIKHALKDTDIVYE